jgi:hypothetical protein
MAFSTLKADHELFSRETAWNFSLHIVIQP